MKTKMKSCTVAPSMECNCATSEDEGATAPATPSATPGLKALANQVLQRNQSRNLSATEAKKTRNFSPNLEPEKLRIPLHELQAEAGEDWPWLEVDPAALHAFIQAVATKRMLERGEVPAHYTAMTVCVSCGPVPLFPDAPERVRGCPWCHGKAGGLTDSASTP